MRPRETEILDALAARLIPSDEHGPGAREANVIRYLERALAGPYSASLPAYRDALAAVDRWAESSHGAGFPELPPQAQDEVVAALERGEVTGSADFFELLRLHVLEGMFGDPHWGGNKGFAGWDLIGYPGLRRVWSEAEQQLDVFIPPARKGRDDL